MTPFWTWKNLLGLSYVWFEAETMSLPCWKAIHWTPESPINFPPPTSSIGWQ